MKVMGVSLQVMSWMVSALALSSNVFSGLLLLVMVIVEVTFVCCSYMSKCSSIWLTVMGSFPKSSR